MKALASSQFEHCSLVCMLHSQGVNDKINFLYDRALKVSLHLYNFCHNSTITRVIAIL